jgi:hypothetical protein
MKTLSAVSLTANIGLLCALAFLLLLFFRLPVVTEPLVIYPDKAQTTVVEKPSVPASDKN